MVKVWGRMVQSLAMEGEGFLPLSFPFCRRTPVLIQSLGRDKARAGGGRGCTPRGATLLFWSFLLFWRLAGERKSSISCCHRQGWVLAQMWVKSDTLWTTYSFSRPPGFSLLLLSFLFLFIYLFIPPSPLSPPPLCLHKHCKHPVCTGVVAASSASPGKLGAAFFPPEK